MALERKAIASMANKATPVDADIIYVIQSPFGANDDRNTTFAQLKTVMATALGAGGSNAIINKHKYDATVAPTTTDDDGSGYAVGSIWVDVTADVAYICLDATTAAAVWQQIDVLTASQILTLLLTVDGAGSGLDSDLLDGVEGSGYYSVGGVDVPVADGGTGASTASAARTNLGLVIGTDVQAWDADLDAVAGISETEGIIRKTGAGTAAVMKTNLAASSAPGPTDDSSAGYGVGSLWCDTTNNVGWTCVDATASAAVWVPLGKLTHTIGFEFATGTFPTVADTTVDLLFTRVPSWWPSGTVRADWWFYATGTDTDPFKFEVRLRVNAVGEVFGAGASWTSEALTPPGTTGEIATKTGVVTGSFTQGDVCVVGVRRLGGSESPTNSAGLQLVGGEIVLTPS